MRKSIFAAVVAACIVAVPAVSQDVRNTYVGVTAQIADNIVTIAKLNGLGTGVGTLLAGTSSGTVGLAGTTSPTFVTPVLGAASATSINFGGTSLANYVEGTWTPTLVGSTIAGSFTYSIQVGSYERIGRQVTVRFNLAVTATSVTPTGIFQISGLPLTSANTTNDRGACVISVWDGFTLTVLYTQVGADILPNTAVARLLESGSGQTGAIVPTIAAAFSLVGACNYHV